MFFHLVSSPLDRLVKMLMGDLIKSSESRRFGSKLATLCGSERERLCWTSGYRRASGFNGAVSWRGDRLLAAGRRWRPWWNNRQKKKDKKQRCWWHRPLLAYVINLSIYFSWHRRKNTHKRLRKNGQQTFCFAFTRNFIWNLKFSLFFFCYILHLPTTTL